MSYKLIVTHLLETNALEKYDVSSLASSIEHFTSIEGQAGKLSFILEKDPNDILKVSEGDMIEFSVINDKTFIPKNVFKGYVFTLGTDSSEAYKVVAYDQTRYLKNKDVMIVSPKQNHQGAPVPPQTISDLFIDICNRNSIKNKAVKATTAYTLPTKIYNNVSYFQIMEEAVFETLSNAPMNPYFFIRDNYGILELNELSLCMTNYIIGDDSLLTDYKYEVDIDKDTYNKVNVVGVDDNGVTTISSLIQNEKSIMKIGVLRTVLPAPKGYTAMEATKLAKLFLEVKDRPTKTITLNAIGVDDLNAGDGFLLCLKKLGKLQKMWITSAIHHYDADNHTMELEVSGFGK